MVQSCLPPSCLMKCYAPPPCDDETRDGQLGSTGTDAVFTTLFELTCGSCIKFFWLFFMSTDEGHVVQNTLALSYEKKVSHIGFV